MTYCWARGAAVACLLAALGLLVACANDGPLLSGVAALATVGGGSGVPVVRPTGARPTQPIRLAYTLGRPATVTVRVAPQAGGPAFVLRAGEHQPAGAHFVLFNGVVPTGAVPGTSATAVARVLPSGAYRLQVSATPDGGAAQDLSADFQVQDARTTPPGLANLQIYPATISPNADAIDDVAQITYRLSETSTTSVRIAGPTGDALTVLAPALAPAGEQKVTFNGQDLFGRSVPDGVYTVTVRAEDIAGNAVEAQSPLTIAGAGTPNIALVEVKITPPALILGGKLHVRMVVQNTGDVPLRTQGPDPGYTYTTNDSYASIAGGRYTDKAGLWRVGLDWEGNTGGPPYRYPYRWGFGSTLAPGATATVEGDVVVLKQERTMWWYAGVLQEGVSIFLDRLGRTPVQVSW